MNKNGRVCPACNKFIQTPGCYVHIPKCGIPKGKKPLQYERKVRRKNKDFMKRIKLVCPYCKKYLKISILYFHIKKCKYENPIKTSSKKNKTLSWIYFLQCKNYIKIGRTNNILKRMIEIQGLNPFPLKLLLVLKGDSKKEASLHARFRKDRIRGEWFILSTQMKAYIIKNQSEIKIDSLSLI